MQSRSALLVRYKIRHKFVCEISGSILILKKCKLGNFGNYNDVISNKTFIFTMARKQKSDKITFKQILLKLQIFAAFLTER